MNTKSIGINVIFRSRIFSTVRSGSFGVRNGSLSFGDRLSLHGMPCGLSVKRNLGEKFAAVSYLNLSLFYFLLKKQIIVFCLEHIIYRDWQEIIVYLFLPNQPSPLVFFSTHIPTFIRYIVLYSIIIIKSYIRKEPFLISVVKYMLIRPHCRP